jgi:dihydroorotate dehydrogenase electron transfer subunit
MREDSTGLPQTVRISSVHQETRTIRTFVLDAEVQNAEPGQFVMLWLPGIDEKPMSIVSPSPLTLAVARVGPFTEMLHRRKVGDLVGWRGPYGKGFKVHADTPALLVAGGCGGAPLVFLASTAVRLGISTTVAVGARTAAELLYADRFRELGAQVHLATDDGTDGHAGPVTGLAAELVQDDPKPAVYGCGPERMLATLHRLCRDQGLPGQFSLERYMKCGFGICGQCALDGFLVCQDGPVFDAEQLDGARDFGRFRRSATGRRVPIR